MNHEAFYRYIILEACRCLLGPVVSDDDEQTEDEITDSMLSWWHKLTPEEHEAAGDVFKIFRQFENEQQHAIGQSTAIPPA